SSNGAPTGRASGAQPRSRRLETVVHEVDDRLQGGPGAEDLDHAHLFQLTGVVLRDDATTEDHDVGGVPLLEQLQDAWNQRHVRAAVQADADRVDIFLDGRLHDHFRCLPQPSVDHLDACVTQSPRDHFDAAVVAVETHF